MAETYEKDRYKRIKNKKDEKNLIADNGLKDNVVDIYDLLSSSSEEPSIRKVKKLRKFGITDKMIVSAYEDISGNVETIDSALDKIEQVFINFATAITNEPNGIIIDLATGNIDMKKSMESAIALGYEIDIHKIKLLDLKDIDEIIDPEKRNKLIEEFSIKFFSEDNLKKNMEILDSYYRTSDKEENVDEMDITDHAKQVIKDVRKELERTDLKKMKLYELEIEINKAEGPRQQALIRQRENFLKKNPRYVGIAANIRDKNGNIRDEVIDEYNIYRKNVKIEFVITQLNKFKKKDISELTPDERKIMVMTALGGLDAIRISCDSQFSKEYSKECWNLIFKLSPELKEIREGEKTGSFKKTLHNFFETELGMEEKFTENNFIRIAKEVGDLIVKGTENARYEKFLKARRFLLGSTTKKIADSIFKRFFDENSVELHAIDLDKLINNGPQSDIEKFFEGSEIEYLDRDKQRYRRTYETASVDSWINNKKEVLKLSYAAMCYMKEKYKSMPQTRETEKMLRKIDKDLEAYEKDYNTSQYKDENGNLKPSIKKAYEKFRKSKGELGLLKYYSLDMLENAVPYNQMDEAHKLSYIKNTIVGLEYDNLVDAKSKNISKIAQRRLELMNTKDKKFITFDTEGNPIINKDLIVAEYEQLSKSKGLSYDALKEDAENRKDEYAYNKIKEYEKIDDKEFVEIKKSNANAVKREAVRTIERIRATTNQRYTSSSNNSKKLNERTEESENTTGKKYIDKEKEESKEKKSEHTFLGNFISKMKNIFKPKLTDGSETKEKNNFFINIIKKLKRQNKNETEINEDNQTKRNKSEKETSTQVANDTINDKMKDLYVGPIFATTQQNQEENSKKMQPEKEVDSEEKDYSK